MSTGLQLHATISIDCIRPLTSFLQQQMQHTLLGTINYQTPLKRVWSMSRLMQQASSIRASLGMSHSSQCVSYDAASQLRFDGQDT